MESSLAQTLTEIRSKALELRITFGAEAQALALEWAIKRIEEAMSPESEQLLNLKDASALCGYSEDHLSRIVRLGRIPSTRRSPHGRIYIRLADLPRRPKRTHTQDADVHELASRLFGGKEGHHGHP